MNTPVTQAELEAKLLALNDPSQPFVVKKEGRKVIVTWNLVDAKWIEVMALAGLNKIVQLELSLNETERTVLYVTEEQEVSWRAGTPEISVSAEKFKGHKIGFETSSAWGMRMDGSAGELYSYTVEYGKLKDSVKATIRESGWQLKSNWSDPSVKIAVFFAVLGGVGALVTVLYHLFS